MIRFLLNLPYTLGGLLLALFSGPQAIKFHSDPLAVVLRVYGFWWAIGYLRGARAVTSGQVILLSPAVQDRDIEHELVHVRQHIQFPFIFPFLYILELLRNGYQNNKYEKEAYRLAGNQYIA